MLRFSLRVATLFLLPAICFAQAAKSDDNSPSYVRLIPKPFSGTIVSVVSDKVTLADKDGKNFIVLMTPGWTVSVNREVDVSVIKPGDFIATTNVPVNVSTGRATEVRILEPGYRPELGTHPFSPTDPKMMTHATVTNIRKNGSDVMVEVTAPDGSRQIIIPQGVHVTISDDLPRTALKPGTPVSGVTRLDSQGVARSSRLQPTPQSHGSSS